jgi:hypothetical protein
MNAEQCELWQRVDAFALDDPAAELPFSARLARENGWSPRHAQRVIAEYKRFLFLAATAPPEAPVCPSEAVDEAWHLHLCYTRSYWHDLCRDLLGRPLHHEPTRGGGEQAVNHRAMYEHTLAAYRAAFGSEPPRSVWPSADERFAARPARKVNPAAHWLVPKPPVAAIVSRLRRKLARVAGLGTAAMLPLVGWVNPLDLPGPDFLKFYAVVLFAAIGGAVVLRSWLRGADDASPLPELDPYSVAVLTGGEKLASASR